MELLHALRDFITSQRGLVILGVALVGITIALPLIYAQTSNTRSVTAGTATDVTCAAPCISTGEIVAGAVTGGAAGVIADGTVTSADIGALGISDSGDFAAGIVNTAAIGANQVTSAKIPTFVSGVIIGTGAAQSTAHGLTGTPTVFFAFLVNDPATTACSITATSATATNLIATVPATCEYRWFAIGP